MASMFDNLFKPSMKKEIQMSNIIRNIGNWFHKHFVSPEQRPLNNRFASSPATESDRETEKDTAENRKSLFDRITGKETMRESLMREIVETEQSRVAKLRNISIMTAEAEHAGLLRDKLAILYRQTCEADRALKRLQYVLRESNDIDSFISEFSTVEDRDEEFEAFLKMNNPDKSSLKIGATDTVGLPQSH